MSAQLSSVVLGAGLMGRLLAHTLAQLGHHVTVYEAQGPDAQGAAARVAAAMLAAAKELGVAIRWGGDWNMNGDSKDEKFYDGPHFELLRRKYP